MIIPKNYLNHGIRLDGRTPLTIRSLTILIGSKGGFCDLTQGKTRVIIFSFIAPSINTKHALFSKVCFSFKFFYQNIIKKSFKLFYQNKKDFFFLVQLILPLSNFFKNWCLDQTANKISGFKPKLGFKIGLIENDGNFQDLIALGVCIAFKSLEIPLVEFHGQHGILKWKTNEFKEMKTRELFFVSTTFSFHSIFDGEILVLIDPTYLEEFYSNSLLFIFIEGQDGIKQLKYGIESGLNEETIITIYRLSVKNFSFLGKLLKKVLIQKISSLVNEEIVVIA